MSKKIMQKGSAQFWIRSNRDAIKDWDLLVNEILKKLQEKDVFEEVNVKLDMDEFEGSIEIDLDLNNETYLVPGEKQTFDSPGAPAYLDGIITEDELTEMVKDVLSECGYHDDFEDACVSLDTEADLFEKDYQDEEDWFDARRAALDREEYDD